MILRLLRTEHSGSSVRLVFVDEFTNLWQYESGTIGERLYKNGIECPELMPVFLNGTLSTKTLDKL